MYVPTSKGSGEENEGFYDDISKIMDQGKIDYTLLMGYSSAKERVKNRRRINRTRI